MFRSVSNRLRFRPGILALALSAPAILFSACGDEAGDGGTSDAGTTGAAPAIVGTYEDAFDTTHTITAELYQQVYDGTPSVTYISQFDDDERWIVGQNASNHPYNPDQWSRYDWAYAGSALFVCQTVFGAESEAEALAVEPADPADPANGGCNDFPWSQLTPVDPS